MLTPVSLGLLWNDRMLTLKRIFVVSVALFIIATLVPNIYIYACHDPARRVQFFLPRISGAEAVYAKRFGKYATWEELLKEDPALWRDVRALPALEKYRFVIHATAGEYELVAE